MNREFWKKQGIAAVWVFIIVGIVCAFLNDYRKANKTIARLEAERDSLKMARQLCPGSGALVTCPICGKFEYKQEPHILSGKQWPPDSTKNNLRGKKR